MTPVSNFVPPYYNANPMYFEPNVPASEYLPPTGTNNVPLPQADPAVFEAVPQQEKAEEKPKYRSEYKQREEGSKIVYVQKKKVEKKIDEQVVIVKEKVEEEKPVEKVAEVTEKPKKEEESIQKEKHPESKGLIVTEIEALENVYPITFLLQFKTKCQRKPKDMRPIEMPLRSNVNLDFTPYEQEGRSENAETVRNLRILLNKLAKENFARISDTILNNFVYNAEILQEFARILFNKCVKEPSFIEVYMLLADQLFKKFSVPKGQPIPQGKEGMNFKKVFLTFCQTTFENQENEDFLKEMPGDLDEEEKSRKRSSAFLEI